MTGAVMIVLMLPTVMIMMTTTICGAIRLHHTTLLEKCPMTIRACEYRYAPRVIYRFHIYKLRSTRGNNDSSTEHPPSLADDLPIQAGSGLEHMTPSPMPPLPTPPCPRHAHTATINHSCLHHPARHALGPGFRRRPVWVRPACSSPLWRACPPLSCARQFPSRCECICW